MLKNKYSKIAPFYDDIAIVSVDIVIDPKNYYFLWSNQQKWYGDNSTYV